MIIPDNMIAHVGKIFSGEYLINYTNEDSDFTILDIGANIGGFARWASYAWPKALIYCYEPISFNYDLLIKNTSDLEKVTCYNEAVGSKKTKRNMYYGKNNFGEASFYLGEEQILEGEKVQVINGKSLPKAHIVKIDTEGAEVEILQNIVFDPHIYLIEYHNSENRRFIDSFLKEYVLIEHKVTSIDYGILKYAHRKLVEKN